MVNTKEETIEIEELKQDQKKEIMKLQDEYNKNEHDRKMKELEEKIKIATMAKGDFSA